MLIRKIFLIFIFFITVFNFSAQAKLPSLGFLARAFYHCVDGKNACIKRADLCSNLKVFDDCYANCILRRSKDTKTPIIIKALLNCPPGTWQKSKYVSQLDLYDKETGTLKKIIESRPSEDEHIKGKIHPPLVNDLGNGNFIPNPQIEMILPDLKNMSKTAFLMRKNDPTVPKILEAFKADGWLITEFKGRTGLNNSIEDNPGFVAYRAADNTMVVVFRGSDSTVITPRKKAADWEVNFDARMIDTPYGKIHRGFYLKTLAAHDSLFQVIQEYLNNLSTEKRQNIKIFFTGHSQGAALAPLAAAHIARVFQATGLLGPNFDNKVSNMIQVYVFSAPRALGDQKALDEIYRALGKQNIVRQNVTGRLLNDPVTVASPGKTTTSLLKLTPFAGKKLSEKYGGGSGKGAGARSVGYLAADKAEDVLKRIVNPETKTLMQSSLNDLKKKNSLESMKSIAKRSVTAIIAPLHYGGIKHDSPVEDGQPYTSIEAMNNAPPVAQLLRQGYEHQLRQRSGIRGKTRQFIEDLADKKIRLEQKLQKKFIYRSKQPLLTAPNS